MKESLLLPLKFILLLIVVFIALCTFNLIFLWGIKYSPGVGVSAPCSLFLFSKNSSSILPVSVILSIFLISFRLRKKPGNHFFSFIFLLAASFLIMAFGFIGLEKLKTTEKCTELEGNNPFSEGYLYCLEDSAVYINKTDKLSVYGIVEIKRSDTPPNISFYCNGIIDPEKEIIKIKDPGKSIKIPNAEPSVIPLFNSPEILKHFFSDISILSKELSSLASKYYSKYLFTCFAIMLFAISCCRFIRISRWPLLNIFFSMFLLWFIFLLHKILSSDLGIETISFLPEKGQQGTVFPAVLTILSIIIIIFNLLFSSDKDKRRDTVNE